MQHDSGGRTGALLVRGHALGHYSVLDIVHDWFGAELDSDLLRHVNVMPQDQIEAFRDYYREQVSRVTLPARRPGETRPAYYWANDPRVRSSLCLADRVVATSPFSSVLDHEQVIPSLFVSDMIQLSHCAKLIESQLLVLLPRTLLQIAPLDGDTYEKEFAVAAELEALTGREACRQAADVWVSRPSQYFMTAREGATASPRSSTRSQVSWRRRSLSSASVAERSRSLNSARRWRRHRRFRRQSSRQGQPPGSRYLLLVDLRQSPMLGTVTC